MDIIANPPVSGSDRSWATYQVSPGHPAFADRRYGAHKMFCNLNGEGRE